MLRRLLVATDGSEHARRAEAFAGQLVAAGQGTQVEVLYVHPCPPSDGGRSERDAPIPVDPRELPPWAHEHAAALLGAARSRLRGADAAVWCRFVGSADVAGMIVHEAERARIDLITLGGREHHGRFLALGSGVCTEVLRRAGRPVLLVP